MSSLIPADSTPAGPRSGSTAAGPSPAASGRVGAIAAWVAVVSVIGLAATGIWLYFHHQPAGAVWAEIEGHDAGYRMGRAIQWLHRVLGLPAAAATVVWLAVVATGRRRGSIRLGVEVGVGVGLVGLIAATAVLGLVLPWDQLALRSITTGTDIRGYTRVFDGEDVTFALLDGQLISVEWLRRWLVVHVVLGVGLAVAVPFRVLGRRRRIRVRSAGR